MDIPITNPHISAHFEEDDHSMMDDSFTQQGTTVNIGSGAVYNQNCGNTKELSRRSAMWRTIIISIVCDIGILCAIFNWQHNIMQKFAMVEEKNAQIHKEVLKQAKEGTIWLLRDDIIKTIEFHEATKKITHKQYKRIKDQFEYYVSIGGNHDVKERFDDFMTKIFGTNEIRMVVADMTKLERAER